MSSPVLLFAKTLGFWAASQDEAAGAGTGRSVGGQPARSLLSPGLGVSPGPGKRGAAASLSLCPGGGVAQEACFQGQAAGQGRVAEAATPSCSRPASHPAPVPCWACIYPLCPRGGPCGF